MKKLAETLKSFVLFLLMISLVLLSVQSFAFEWLYPNGISAVAIKSLYRLLPISALGPFQDEGELYKFDRYLWPSSLSALTENGDFVIFFNGDVSTLQVNSAARLFAQVLEHGKLTAGSKPFEEVIKTDGLLLDFGRKLPLDAFVKLVDGKSSISIPDREVFLRREGESLFFHSYGLGSSYYQLDSNSDSDEFTQIYDGISLDAGAQRVEISGRTSAFSARAGRVLPSGETRISALRPYNPLYQEGSIISSYPLGLALDAFDYNISTLRRDVEPDGSIVYVENYSSIKLSPSGMLEFKASEVKKGVPISKYILPPTDSGYTLFEVMTASYFFLDSFTSQLTGGPAATLRYTGAEYNEKKEELSLYFDYVAFGLPIKQAEGHAVKIAYNNGYFTEAKLFFRGYGELEGEYYPAKIKPHLTLAEQAATEKIADANFLYNDNDIIEDIFASYAFYTK